MNAALSQLNNILMSLCYVACTVVVAVVMVRFRLKSCRDICSRTEQDVQIAPLIAGVCALVLGQSRCCLWIYCYSLLFKDWAGSLVQVSKKLWLVLSFFLPNILSTLVIVSSSKTKITRSRKSNCSQRSSWTQTPLSFKYPTTSWTILLVFVFDSFWYCVWFSSLKFIHNSRRSSHVSFFLQSPSTHWLCSKMSETFLFDVRYSTSSQEIEKIRQKMFEFVKFERRDFQPVFDVMVKGGRSSQLTTKDLA